jgi:hypothetical protein
VRLWELPHKKMEIGLLLGMSKLVGFHFAFITTSVCNFRKLDPAK